MVDGFETSARNQVNELRGLGKLAFQAFGAATAGVQETHQAIAHRVFTAIGLPSAPTRMTHDAIAGLVYGSVRGAGAAIGAAADAALDAYPWPGEGRVISRTRRGRAALSVLNGLLGDQLDTEHSDLRVEMGLHAGRHELRELPARLPAETADLRSAVPDATGRLAVFLHGLGETETSWRSFAREHYGDPDVTYGSRLADDLGYTPLYLRYNTGLPVAENGRRLAELLEQTVTAWPVPVEKIDLIGHSTGGLVLCAACGTATAAGHHWVDAVRHAVHLGSPHLGARLEQAANVAARLLTVFPETRPFSKVVNLRSSGIRDLHPYRPETSHDRGRQRDDDYTVRMGDTPVVPMPGHARHYFVDAAVTRTFGTPATRLLDYLPDLQDGVSRRAREGTWRIAPEPGGNGPFDRVRPFRILNHPTVYEQLHTWLADLPVSREPVRQTGGELTSPRARPPSPPADQTPGTAELEALFARRVREIDLSGTPLADVRASVLFDIAPAGQWLIIADHGSRSHRRVDLTARIARGVSRRGGKRPVQRRYQRVLAGSTDARWPDALVTTDPATMAAILEGRRSGIYAFLDDELTVRGNLGLVLQLDGIAHTGQAPSDFPRAHVVEALGARTAYLEAGRQDAPPVLLLHGLGSSNSSMLPLLRGLAEDYRVIAPDIPGSGASEAPQWDYSAAALGRWAIAFQEAVGARPAAMVGNSLGGRVALEAALTQPDAVERLVLLCPSMAFLRWRQFQFLVRQVSPDVARVHAPLRIGARQVLRAMFAVPERLSEASYDAAVDEFCRVMTSPAHRRANLSTLLQIYVEKARDEQGFWDRLPRLRPPALFVWGDHDRLVPAAFARHVTAALPGADSIVMRDCGHVPQFEHPERTLELTLEFLGRATG